MLSNRHLNRVDVAVDPVSWRAMQPGHPRLDLAAGMDADVRGASFHCHLTGETNQRDNKSIFVVRIEFGDILLTQVCNKYISYRYQPMHHTQDVQTSNVVLSTAIRKSYRCLRWPGWQSLITAAQSA